LICFFVQRKIAINIEPYGGAIQTTSERWGREGTSRRPIDWPRPRSRL